MKIMSSAASKAAAAVVTAAMTTTSSTHAMSTTTSQMLPRAYLGTMTFGWKSQTSSHVDEDVALQMVQEFVAFDQKQGNTHHNIDTARIYAGGKTEVIVGQVLKRLPSPTVRQSIWIGTKAAPSQDGGLSVRGIQSQYMASMASLQLDEKNDSANKEPLLVLREYYLHQPDTEHSLLESLKEADRMVQEGLITKIGMSNYHVAEVERAFELCSQYNLTPPSVYQGLYNPLNRRVEEELLPLLHQNECAFVAYNPLAAGLLTGKHTTAPSGAGAGYTDKEVVAKGRFHKNSNYMPRFYTPANLEAVRLIQDQCHRDGVSMIEATFQWLLRHSALDGTKGDGYLLGASSLAQLQQNLHACRRASDVENTPGLSPEMLETMDEAWKMCQEEGAFCYWRSYSADMPHRATLDPGASYNAAKTTTSTTTAAGAEK